MATVQHDVTNLLIEIQKGNSEALASLIPLVYSELRRLASRQLGYRPSEQTLNTTGLVHEAFLKLVGPADVRWESRAHFFGAAANAMRQIIVAEARKRLAQKRGGSLSKVSLDEGAILTDTNADQFVALDEALKELAACDERLARIVELRFFAGLTIEETANALSISPATVKRDWTAARAFLHRTMSSES
jgi:RNA polymerase sigma factor (TIGR02999 family)